MISIFSSAGHKVSVTVVQFCHCGMKVAMEKNVNKCLWLSYCHTSLTRTGKVRLSPWAVVRRSRWHVLISLLILLKRFEKLFGHEISSVSTEGNSKHAILYCSVFHTGKTLIFILFEVRADGLTCLSDKERT